MSNGDLWLHDNSGAVRLSGPRESADGVHKFVFDVFVHKHDKPALCVCADCLNTWLEGGTTPRCIHFSEVP